MKRTARVDVVVLQDIIAPYKTLLFNALRDLGSTRFAVVYFAETQANRDWKVSRDALKFEHEVLFPGRIEDTNVLTLGWHVYKALSAKSPAVVVIGGYSAAAYWVGLTWAILHRRKAVVISESHFQDKRRLLFKEWVKRIFFFFCSAALVDGLKHKEYAVRLGMPASRVFIKNGTGPIDVTWYRSSAAEARKRKAYISAELGIPARNFLFVGRFAEEKNLYVLLDAFKEAGQEGGEQWGLILVGNGPLRQKLERYVLINQISNVLFPGFKEGMQLALFYGISDVLILPSISEPWGLVVNEALASGLPVIASSKCGCVPDLVRDGINGFVFDPESRDQLIKKMRLFMENEVNPDVMVQSTKELLEDFSPRRVAEIHCQAIAFAQSTSV